MTASLSSNHFELKADFLLHLDQYSDAVDRLGAAGSIASVSILFEQFLKNNEDHVRESGLKVSEKAAKILAEHPVNSVAIKALVNKEPGPIATLPDDILGEILSHGSLADISRARRISKTFASAGKDKLENLTSLDLRNQAISAYQFEKLLRQCPNVRTIFLPYLSPQDQHLEIIAQKKPDIEQLYFDPDTRYSRKSWEKVVTTCNKLHSINVPYIWTNKLNTLIETNKSSLVGLDLGVHPDSSGLNLDTIDLLVSQCSHLQKLTFSRNSSLSPEQLKTLLKTAPQLWSLQLPCGCDDKHLGIIAEHRPNLRELIIPSPNQCTNAGLRLIADSCQNLEVFEFEGSIDDGELTDIIIKNGKTLRSLLLDTVTKARIQLFKKHGANLTTFKLPRRHSHISRLLRAFPNIQVRQIPSDLNMTNIKLIRLQPGCLQFWNYSQLPPITCDQLWGIALSNPDDEGAIQLLRTNGSHLTYLITEFSIEKQQTGVQNKILKAIEENCSCLQELFISGAASESELIAILQKNGKTLERLWLLNIGILSKDFYLKIATLCHNLREINLNGHQNLDDDSVVKLFLANSHLDRFWAYKCPKLTFESSFHFFRSGREPSWLEPNQEEEPRVHYAPLSYRFRMKQKRLGDYFILSSNKRTHPL